MADENWNGNGYGNGNGSGNILFTRLGGQPGFFSQALFINGEGLHRHINIGTTLMPFASPNNKAVYITTGNNMFVTEIGQCPFRINMDRYQRFFTVNLIDRLTCLTGIGININRERTRFIRRCSLFYFRCWCTGRYY